jgi:hypothetical protein
MQCRDDNDNHNNDCGGDFCHYVMYLFGMHGAVLFIQIYDHGLKCKELFCRFFLYSKQKVPLQLLPNLFETVGRK